MFDATQNGIAYFRKKLPDPCETLKHKCRSSADLWAIKRRANRPYRASQRLPAVARSA
jgi:hypothetical protein